MLKTTPAPARWKSAVFVFVLLASLRALAPEPLFAADTPKIPSCAGPEYREFGFWIGDWDAYDMPQPAKVVARNRVDRILNGCVLLEDYQATNGSRGESFTLYDASRKVWHQTWVTNAGKLLVIEGANKNGEMILTGMDRTPDSKQRLVRGVWKPVKGGVRETAMTSNDGGKTWTPWFDMLFRPHGR